MYDSFSRVLDVPLNTRSKSACVVFASTLASFPMLNPSARTTRRDARPPRRRRVVVVVVGARAASARRFSSDLDARAFESEAHCVATREDIANMMIRGRARRLAV
jgi:hypothetical protein